MKTVRVIFSRRRNIGSVLLRTYLWSAWSHCGIIDGDEVVEAVMSKGVSTRTLDEFKAAASAWEIVEIPAADPAAVIAAARGRIGNGYDWLGVLALLLRIDIQRTVLDFCSELIAWSFKAGGTPLFRIEACRITPRDLYIRAY
jgi:hypothetical protein